MAVRIQLRLLMLVAVAVMSTAEAKATQAVTTGVVALSCDLEMPGGIDEEAVNGSCTRPLSIGDHNCYNTGGDCPNCQYECYTPAFGWHNHTWSNGCHT
jgi:hypothetical protein